MKFKDRWLAAVPSVSESSSSSESRQFSGARSTSAESSASGRRRSLSRSISRSSEQLSRAVRKRRLQVSSSSESEDSTSESEPPRKRLKKKTPQEIEEEMVYKLRDMIEITGHPKSELNGICGLLEYWVVDKKLWIVRVAGNLLKQTLKIKPKFMKKVTAEEAKAAMEKIKESKEKQRLLNKLLKTRIRSGLERAKTKDEENQNAKAKKLADFGVITNGKQGSVSEKLSPPGGEKVEIKRPLIEKPVIVKRKQEGIGPPEPSIAPSHIPTSPFQPYPQYPAGLSAPFVGGIFPPPMVPFGMQPPSTPTFTPVPFAEPTSIPTLGPTLTSVSGKGKRPLIPTLPIANPPIQPMETNLEEEIMDQGPDSDEEASNDGPTAPPPKYTKPPVFRFNPPPFPLGPPPMKPPTAQNTKDPPAQNTKNPPAQNTKDPQTPPKMTDPISNRNNRIEEKLNHNPTPSFQKPPGPLSKQHLFNGSFEKPSVPLSEQNISNVSPNLPSPKVSPKKVSTTALRDENSVVDEIKTPVKRKPEQRTKMTFEFKTVKSSRRSRKKMKFPQTKPENANQNKKTVDKDGSITEMAKSAIVTLEEKIVNETDNKRQEETVKEKKTATSDAIRERILQINAQLRKKKEELEKKKKQESKKSKVEKKSMSRSQSKVVNTKASSSRSRSKKSSSRSISRSRGRRKRRSRFSKSRSRSYSSRSRSRSSRSFSRSSSYSSRSRSRQRRRRRRSRRSSSYSSNSSYY